jgi:hypothetical protein
VSADRQQRACRPRRSRQRRRGHAASLKPPAGAKSRLKHLARNQPDLPASTELSDIEVEALRAAKSRIKKRTETIPDEMPTIGQAVRWIADLGGYTGPRAASCLG